MQPDDHLQCTESEAQTGELESVEVKSVLVVLRYVSYKYLSLLTEVFNINNNNNLYL